MTKSLRQLTALFLCCLLILQLCSCAVIPTVFLTSEPAPEPSSALTAEPTSEPTHASTPEPTPELVIPSIPALEERYFISQLSGNELDFCALIYSGMLELEPKIDLSYIEGIDFERAQTLIQALFDDCPELFMCTGEYPLWGIDHVSSAEFQYRLDKGCYDSAAAEISALTTSWQEAAAGFSDYDMAMFAYNEIAARCSYTADTAMSDTAYGALIEGKALCQGYSKAFQLAMHAFGIPCLFVSSEELVHGWNTWDDSGDMGTYTYFNMSDKMAEKYGHVYDRSPAWSYPACKSLDANYYSRNGLLIPIGVDVREVFISALDKIHANGGGRLTLMFESSDQLRELTEQQRDWVYDWNRDKYLTVSYTRIIPEHNEYVYIADFCFE